jgi:hypothetical protein
MFHLKVLLLLISFNSLFVIIECESEYEGKFKIIVKKLNKMRQIIDFVLF